MECEEYVKNGDGGSPRGLRVGSMRRSQRKLGGELRLDFARTVVRKAGRRTTHHTVHPQGVSIVDHIPAHIPFMSNMDEITYWIYTKRAPCLMNYNNIIKRQTEEVLSSKSKPGSSPSVIEAPSLKKKKRKLSLLDEDSLSEHQHNIYFDTSQEQNMMSKYKFDTVESDVDFNIKNSSVHKKPKRNMRKNNRCNTLLHKNNAVVTSTPKVPTLRRSLRHAKNTLNNDSQLDSSFEILGNHYKNNVVEQNVKNELKNVSEIFAGEDQNVHNKKTIENSGNSKNIHNGQFEDISDVSGFTANYIRSTKLQLNTPRKLRCKTSRNLVKESHPIISKNNTTVCVNKSVNTGLQKSTLLNCSTDSSQNIINLVTEHTNDKCTRVNKSSSILKFMDVKMNKSHESIKNRRHVNNRSRGKTSLKISFESNNSSSSRYPKRYKNNITNDTPVTDTSEVVAKRRRVCKKPSKLNNCNHKENPEAVSPSKTRSGRYIGLTPCQTENSVLVLSNSTEKVSSMATVNVATPHKESTPQAKKKRHVTRQACLKKSKDKSFRLQKDSLREKSAFSACFSDSDEDSEPLKQKKFFCD